MLNLNETRIANGGIVPMNVLPAEIGKVEAGNALVRVWSGGAAYVKRSAGEAGEDYVGVAFGPSRPGADAIFKHISHTITAVGGVVQPFVANNNLATAVQATDVPTVYLVSDGVRTVFTKADAAAAGSYVLSSLAPLTLAFHADDVGKTVNIYFHALPTIDDVIAMGIGGPEKVAVSEDILGVVSVVVAASSLVTDKFDSSVDWYTGGVLKTAANGRFTLGGGGTAVDGSGAIGGYSRLVAAPNGENGGICISVNI